MFNHYFELEARDVETIGRQESGGHIWSWSWMRSYGCVADRSYQGVDKEWHYSIMGTYDKENCSMIDHYGLGWKFPGPLQVLPLSPALVFPYQTKTSKLLEANQEYERFSRLPAPTNQRRLLALRR